MKRIISGILSFLSLTINYSCNTTEPPTPPPPDAPKAVTLNLIEKTCTEAFISITAEDTVLPVNITLDRDDNLLFNFTLTKLDTTIIDENLLPGKTYVYQTRSIIKGKEEIGDTLQVRTLDTTSHNFSWQAFSFGDFASSILYDVSIIDENNIYAVGEIYLKDSTGQPDQLLYNIMHWNGTEWKAERAQTNFRGNLITVPLEGIFVFSSNDIWLIGSLPIHGDGNQWQIYDLRTMVDPNLSLSKAWGKSSNDIYFVGRTGSIAYYNGSIWQKIESGTELNLNDIWGDYNERTNELEILAVGGNILQGTDRIILRITNGDQIQQISPEGTVSYPLGSVWSSNNLKHYIGGAGLYKKYYNESNWKEIPLPKYYTYSIRGNGSNDIIVCGGVGYIAHFNGNTWINYLGNGLKEISGNYYSAVIKGNTVVAVGNLAEGKAIAIIGKR